MQRLVGASHGGVLAEGIKSILQCGPRPAQPDDRVRKHSPGPPGAITLNTDTDTPDHPAQTGEAN